ncbi:MAG: hypothetical protein ACK4PR_04820, partial [Gammaproteobacteria bacterium]
MNDLFIAIWATINSKEREHLTELNVSEVAKFIRKQVADKQIKIPNALKQFFERRLETWIKNAYLANDMQENKEYVIPKKGEKHSQVIIMDLDTGVEQITSQWSNGLHQFIQLKHSKKLSQESLKAVFMSNIVFFQSYNGHIMGLTGTMGSTVEMDLMAELYGIDYFRLPRNKPYRYVQEAPILVASRYEWQAAISNDVVTTQSIRKQHEEKVLQKATDEIKICDERLGVLLYEKNQLEATLAKENETLKALKNKIDLLSEQLTRHIEIRNDATKDVPSRADLLLEKELQEKAVGDCEKRIIGYLQSLENITLGKNGIGDVTNQTKNAANVLTNSGARPILLTCATVHDVDYLAKVLRSQEALSKSNIITITSKYDPVPSEKLGLND